MRRVSTLVLAFMLAMVMSIGSASAETWSGSYGPCQMPVNVHFTTAMYVEHKVISSFTTTYFNWWGTWTYKVKVSSHGGHNANGTFKVSGGDVTAGWASCVPA